MVACLLLDPAKACKKCCHCHNLPLLLRQLVSNMCYILHSCTLGTVGCRYPTKTAILHAFNAADSRICFARMHLSPCTRPQKGKTFPLSPGLDAFAIKTISKREKMTQFDNPHVQPGAISATERKTLHHTLHLDALAKLNRCSKGSTRSGCSPGRQP